MELQIPYRICAEISPESVLEGKTSGSRENSAAAVRMERGKDNRGRSVPGSHPSIRGDTAKDVGIKLYGVLKREEQHNAV